MKLYQPYKYDADQVSQDTGLACEEGSSKTKQSFKDESDINNIVSNFGLLGNTPDMPLPEHFGDFTEVTDYQTALNMVRQAGESFLTVPAHVRERFNNDPGVLMAFLGQETNRQEAIALGLIPPPPLDQQTAPEPVKSVAPATAGTVLST